MAKYDQGGGCPCGLYAECEPNCKHAVKTMVITEKTKNNVTPIMREIAERFRQLSYKDMMHVSYLLSSQLGTDISETALGLLGTANMILD